jgi:hypothetical protein
MRWAALCACILMAAAGMASFKRVLNLEFRFRDTYELGIGAARIYFARLDSPFVRSESATKESVIRLGRDHWDYRPSSAHVYADIALPIPLCLMIVATGLLFWLHRPCPPGHCPNCGYDLTANVSGKCPECGRPVDRGSS